MKGISVKRIAELFKTKPIEMRTEETDPGLKEDEKLVLDSFQKRRALLSNDSSRSSHGNLTENSYRRHALAQNSYRGQPIKLKRKPISAEKHALRHSANSIWDCADVNEPVLEERNTVDGLVKGSLFSKRNNAFNLSDKHKMFFALPKKSESLGARNSFKTKESTKDASKPMVTSETVLASTKNLIPKAASLNLENLRQLYLKRSVKGPKLISAGPMPSPAQQLMANIKKPEQPSISNIESGRSSVYNLKQNISKPFSNIEIQISPKLRPNVLDSLHSPPLQPRQSLMLSSGTNLSKRVKMSDRLNLIKVKDQIEVKFAPQNTDKVLT